MFPAPKPLFVCCPKSLFLGLSPLVSTTRLQAWHPSPARTKNCGAALSSHLPPSPDDAAPPVSPSPASNEAPVAVEEEAEACEEYKEPMLSCNCPRLSSLASLDANRVGFSQRAAASHPIPSCVLAVAWVGKGVVDGVAARRASSPAI